MSFHNVSLPSAFQYGSHYGPGFATAIQETASGHEYRIANQAAPRHRSRMIKALQNPNEMGVLKTFVIARRGSLHSFRQKDWSDYTTAENGTGATTNLDVALGTGDGSETQFQLIKTYDEGGLGEFDRVITLPAGTMKVAVAAGAQVEGSDYTVSNPGGIITFTSVPGAGAPITAGFEFDMPVRFDISADQWASIRSDAFDVWTLADIGCIEVLNEVEWPELFYPGGVQDWTGTNVDVTMTFAQGVLHVFDTTTPIDANLPAPPVLFPGGPELFTVHVEVGSSAVQLRDHLGVTFGSAISGGNTKRVGAYVTAAGLLVWIVY